MSEGIPTTRTGMRLEEEQALSSTCSSLFMSSAPERAGSNEFFRQFLSTVGAELAHCAGAMKFHRPDGELQAFCNLSVGELLPGEKRNLALAIGECREGFPRLPGICRLNLCRAFPGKGLVDRREKLLGPNGLGEKGDGAAVDRIDRHFDVAVSGKKNDGKINLALLQNALQHEAAHLSHPYVENSAAGIAQKISCEEILSTNRDFARMD